MKRHLKVSMVALLIAMVTIARASVGEATGDCPTPLYCVIDLSGGVRASSYPVSYLNSAPNEGWTDEYKTTKLVLRRLDAGEYKMQDQYAVGIMRPFYIGIFEVTQKQWELVMGENPSKYKGDSRPVQVSYHMIRGDLAGASWPESSVVDRASFLGCIRERTGLELDLPSEAQWEYACRAGTTSKYNNGGSDEEDLQQLGRYGANKSDGVGGYSDAYTNVGSYRPNCWGLYDMHGNACEWCADWFGRTLKASLDPSGPESGTSRVMRGGSWEHGASDCSSLRRDYMHPTIAGCGFRLVVKNTDERPAYKVVYNACGGECVINSQYVSIGDELSCLPYVMQEYRGFLGWYTAREGGVQVTRVTKLDKGDVTLYAHWMPLYCVVDLSNGSAGDSYPVTYLDSMPDAGWKDEYKTKKLVLRQIMPGSFKMFDQYFENYTVKLTKPFYIGVFEVTQRQWELVMGNRPSYFKNDEYYAMRPVEQVNYYMVRGGSVGNPLGFVDRMCERTKLPFDIPTEAQWEYACRAGTQTEYNNGKSGGTESAKNRYLGEVGRFWNNGGSEGTEYSDTSAGTAKVGSYEPNVWGLYDMHGNVCEWCADWYEDAYDLREEYKLHDDLAEVLYDEDGHVKQVIDPKGARSGICRVWKGGGWSSEASICTSSFHGPGDPENQHYSFGCRIFMDVQNVGVKISYDANGGACQTSEQIVKTGIELLDLPTPKRDEFLFLGWYTERESGTQVKTVFDVHVSTTLFAHWQRAVNRYLVQFDAAGGSCPVDSRTYKEGSVIGQLPLPEKRGYMFEGWFTSLSGGVKVTEQSVVAAPMTLYARWNLIADVFVIDKDGKLTKYLGAGGDVIVPDSVTSIGARAFEGCVELMSITIPSNVKSIGDNAFKGCSGLTAVGIPGNAGECSTLFPDAYTKITTVHIQDGSEKIVQYMFKGCVKLASVTIPFGVQRVEMQAFYGCSALKSVMLPVGVAYVGTQAFYGCSNLEVVSLPASVSEVEYQAFYGCGELKSVTFPAGLWKCSELFPGSYKTIETIIVSEGVTSIVGNAFSSCRGMKSIVIPSTVEHIGQSAFYGCEELKSLTLPQNLKSVDRSAFSGCTGLSSISIPECVTNVGANAFSGCSSLMAVAIPSCVKMSSAFPDTYKTIKIVVIHDGVAEIGKSKFENCLGLVSITIPSSVTNIGERAFWGCKGLKVVAIPSSVASIGSSAFGGCSGLSHVNIEDIIKWCGISFGDKDANPLNLGRHLFLGDKEVVSWESPAEVTSIGKYAFCGCGGLRSLMISSGVTNIGYQSFFNCSNLTSLAFQEGVSMIGEGAFWGCKGLTTVVIPSSVKDIGQDAFRVCSGLRSATLPATMTSVPNSMFYQCENLQFVEIPNGVTNIDANAFLGCTTIGSFAIPSSMVSIGSSAFSGCSSLERITLPSSVMAIGVSAFENCGLTSIEIPSGMSKIKDRVFKNCSKLRSVKIPNSVVSIGSEVFLGCDAIVSITIPGCVGQVLSLFRDSCWTISEATIADGSSKINSSVFSLCTGLKEVTIPPSVKSIGSWSFNDCRGLEDVTLPDGVVTIEEHAFLACSGLKSVVIPSSVTDIGYGAFEACKRLSVVCVEKGDLDRVRGMYAWPNDVVFVENIPPVIVDDEGATVNGDPISGFIIKPSAVKTEVEVSIPQGVDASKVTVEVSPKVASVKLNGAKVKIVSGGADITEFLNVPAADGNGVVELTKATVKEEIVKETMDVEKGAEIELNAANPKLTTAPTREGLFYQLREGETLDGMKDGDSTIGNGQPWTPKITVKDGDSAFYSIGVGKGN